MATEGYDEFEKLIIENSDEVGISILLVLVWLASSDGEIDENEMDTILKIAAATKHIEAVNTLITVIRNQDIKSIQLACEIIVRKFQREKSHLFMEMAIGIAISDSYLLVNENYILRFIADLLKIEKTELNDIFRKMTGKDLPDPTDISSADYWINSDRTNERSRDDTTEKPSENTTKFTEALKILGLSQGASKEDIKKAYRRKAQINHPDRYAPLGKEAVASATVNFQKIQKAYEYLVNYA